MGLMSLFVDDLQVNFLSGHRVPFELSNEDDQRLVNELIDAYNEPDEPPDCYGDRVSANRYRRGE